MLEFGKRLLPTVNYYWKGPWDLWLLKKTSKVLGSMGNYSSTRHNPENTFIFRVISIFNSESSQDTCVI